jgi:hypothetical protein
VLVGESTPEYMYDERVPARISEIIPAARLITILRDPVDRAYSHYWHNRTRGHEPLSFEDAVKAEPERISGADPLVRARYAYLDRGRYARQLQRVSLYFSRDSIRVVSFEDLRYRRSQLLADLYRFLGVGAIAAQDANEGVKNRFVVFRSQKLRGPIRRLPGPLRRVAGRLNIQYSMYPPIDESLRDRLRDAFAEDDASLAHWWGLSSVPWRR